MAPYYLIHRLKENVLYSLEFFWKYIIIISSFKTWHYQTFKHVTSERTCQEFDLTTWLSHLQIEVQAAIARRVSVHASVQLWKWLTNRFAEWGMWAAYWIKVTFTNLLFLHYQASGKVCRRQMTSGANLSALVGVGCRWSALVGVGRRWSALVGVGRRWSALVGDYYSLFFGEYNNPIILYDMFEIHYTYNILLLNRSKINWN